MCLFSLRFFGRRYRRYRALFLTDNALSVANHLFLLAFSESVIDVIDVIGTSPSADWRSGRVGGLRTSFILERNVGPVSETPA